MIDESISCQSTALNVTLVLDQVAGFQAMQLPRTSIFHHTAVQLGISKVAQ